MRDAFGKLGYSSEDSLAALMDRLGNETGYIVGDQAVATYQSAIDQATGMLDLAFDFNFWKYKIAVIGGKEGNYYTAAPRTGSRPVNSFKGTN